MSAGISQRVILSDPAPGDIDADDHMANPKILYGQLARLTKLDWTFTQNEG